MRLREHRGGLQESIDTTIVVQNRTALVSYIRAALQPFGRDVFDQDVEIRPYGGDDGRTGWRDVHIVTVRGYGVFGFIEGNPQ